MLVQDVQLGMLLLHGRQVDPLTDRYMLSVLLHWHPEGVSTNGDAHSMQLVAVQAVQAVKLRLQGEHVPFKLIKYPGRQPLQENGPKVQLAQSWSVEFVWQSVQLGPQTQVSLTLS